MRSIVLIADEVTRIKSVSTSNDYYVRIMKSEEGEVVESYAIGYNDTWIELDSNYCLIDEEYVEREFALNSEFRKIYLHMEGWIKYYRMLEKFRDAASFVYHNFMNRWQGEPIDLLKAYDAYSELWNQPFVSIGEEDHLVRRAVATVLPKFGYVYIIPGPNESYKIGKTITLEGRLKTHGVKLPYPVQYAHTFPCENMSTTESALHDFYAHSHINGEWYVLSELQLSELKQITHSELSTMDNMLDTLSIPTEVERAKSKELKKFNRGK